MKIFVIGAGAFGTAISSTLCLNTANEVYLWSNIKEEAIEINKTRINEKYFPKIGLNSSHWVAGFSNISITFFNTPPASIG